MSEIYRHIDDEVDRFFEAREAIFEHVGYVESWRVLPIDDVRDEFWAVDKYEREWVKFSPKREALVYWLAGHADEYGPYGNEVYENVIYTQRHLPKWVYRGAELTLIVVDTQTDDNKYLQIFSNENEVLAGMAEIQSPQLAVPVQVPSPQQPQVLSPQHPLNQAIDRMIAADQLAPSDDLLATVRSMCAAVPTHDLHVAIAAHRWGCHQPGCPVLAAMEEAAT